MRTVCRRAHFDEFMAFVKVLPLARAQVIPETVKILKRTRSRRFAIKSFNVSSRVESPTMWWLICPAVSWGPRLTLPSVNFRTDCLRFSSKLFGDDKDSSLTNRCYHQTNVSRFRCETFHAFILFTQMEKAEHVEVMFCVSRSCTHASH